MRRLVAVLASVVVFVGLPTTQATAAEAFDSAPATAALTRLVPTHSSQFSFTAVPKPSSGDYYSISGTPGAVKVSGTSPAVLLAGVGWYLKYVAKVDIGWPGDSLSRLPATLPAPAATITKSATVAHRFALNDTDDGYSGAYRDWTTFQRQVDLLALHGFNEIFVQMGADAAYYGALQEFGYSKAELQSWIPSPSRQPWWLMQNMAGFPGPVSEQLITARAAMGKKIVDHTKALGMTPVLPGFFGTVPPNFVAKNPTGRVVPQGTWYGFFDRPDWLDPRNVMFGRVAEAFFRHQAATVGTTSMYKMDLLHEGGDPGDVPVGDAARAVFTALDTARPGAIWVLLGWQSNPPVEIIDNVDHNRLFIVDGLSDKFDNTDRDTQWKGAPYAFGTIPNFGGHTSIGANSAVWATRFDQWRTKPNSALKGIAYLPEGTGTDPATFELFAELAWRTGPIDHTAWFADYAARRYAGTDTRAAAAWDQLRRGPYSMPSGSSTEPQDSLFAARPSLTVTRAASWSPGAMRYNAVTVRRALTELLAVAPALRSTNAYKYDLVQTARQALANRSRALLPAIKLAYDAKDLTKFRALAAEWKSDMNLLDRLLASDKNSLLGPWLRDAKAWGTTAAEKTALEYDARSIMTTWGTSDNALHDYANRELSGLVADFYTMRWTKYLDSLDTALVNNTAPAGINWFAVEDAWNRETKTYSNTPTGDPYALATEVNTALPRMVGPITGIGGKCVDVTDGSATPGTATQLYVCNQTAAQTWEIPGDKSIRALGLCLDARGGGTVNGTVVQVYGCNGSLAQQWTAHPDGTLRNGKSGLCLDAEASGTANGTRLLLWSCSAGVNQRWTVPA
ncbi:Alpha-N-acetylglucosaminidase [Alloactinosynnema sp. L-07]|uniref:alpha-N-acetylglucosaminidase n=1 Tax=Alloactinosynnema sp. L-07 TaxID=1653480 RepID=UPI00065EF289|nr:alpha-N-acetylglucosaminidase TIM-barrel domain-containing protein [Alloactinosynnema sp. L-07]CRK60110.1 Alpha-N-acetylglucosaminidase [Alloactinosynnema sp. L-07]